MAASWREAAEGGLSPRPVPQERLLSSPGQASPSPSPASSLATPTGALLYRSAFAGECEAIARQLRGGGGGEEEAHPGRRPSTLEAEALLLLTPLGPGGPSWSFLCDAFQTPAAAAAEDLPRRPARTPPPQEEEEQAAAAAFSPPPGTPNRTYDCEEEEGEADKSRGTDLCEESPAEPEGGSFASGGLPARDDGDAPRRRETFELPPTLEDPRPLVTSTPLWAQPGSAEPCGSGGQRSALGSEEEEGDGGGRLALPAGSETDAASSSSSRSQTQRTARPRPPPRPPPGSTIAAGGEAARKGPRGRKSLVLAPGGTPRRKPPRAGAASLRPPTGKGGVKRVVPPRASVVDLPRASALPGKRLGSCTQQSMPQGQKQLPDEMKKPLSKLPSYKNTSGPTQAPASLTRGVGADGLLTYVGLESNVCAENGTRGTRLPVRTAGDKRSKVGVQKCPPEKLADSSTGLKQPLPKRPCQGRGLMEKRTGGPLLAVGQIPRATTGNSLVAPCLQGKKMLVKNSIAAAFPGKEKSKCRRLSEENQRLTEENQQLKAMLDNLTCKAADK